jgi:hypothetical protein
MSSSAATLSNATDTYEIIAGFFNTNDGSTAITDGFYALYTHGTNGGKWQANCVANGSAGTPLDIGVTFAVDTTYRLHFTFNAAGTSVSVAIATNGGALSAAQTFVANIPVGAFRNFGYGMRIRRTAGNSNNRVAYAGMCDFDMVPTNPL